MSNPSFIITNVTVTPILIQDAPLLNLQGVHQPYTPRLVVRIETQGGQYGVGETYGDTEIMEYLTLFADSLTGMTVDQSQNLWQVAKKVLTEDVIRRIDPGLVSGELSRQVTGDNTLSKVHNTAVSVFEVAFLDALGKLTGLPVHTFLGGKSRDKVDFAAYLFWKFGEHPGADDPQDTWGEAINEAGIVRQAELFVQRYGFRSLKLKGGYHTPDVEAAAIKAIKKRFPDHPVRLDPNGIWSVETGTRIARELDGVVEYLEDPTMGRDGMAAVHRATGVTLATNMCVTSMDQIPEAVALGSAQVVLCDHHFWGGLRATQHLSRICQAFGMGLSMHSNTHLGVSLAAMLHAAGAAEGDLHACDTHRPWQTEDIITEPHQFVDGALTVPDAPGLGVELDEDSVAALHQRWVEMPEMRIRDDVAAMCKFQPDWVRPQPPRW
jgi:glucarate dehydratase